MPDIVIQVTGGGSGVGLSALINGTTDIADASRPMKKSEMEKLKLRFNSLGSEIKSAKDGVTLYLNESNPINELSIDQIKAIYLGEITNWKDVAAKTAPERMFTLGTMFSTARTTALSCKASPAPRPWSMRFPKTNFRSDTAGRPMQKALKCSK